MPPINVLLSGLPSSLCLSLGDILQPLPAQAVAQALVSATGLPPASFFLRQHGALLHPTHPVSAQGQHTTFVTVCLRRALPGGKGGFGAMLRGSAASKKTTNFDACRDLEGRRLRQVRDEEAVRSFLRERREGGREQGDSKDDTAASTKKRPREGLEESPKTDEVPVDVEKVDEDMERIGRGVADAVADALAQGLGKRKRRRGGVRRKAAIVHDRMVDCDARGEDKGGSDAGAVALGKEQSAVVVNDR